MKKFFKSLSIICLALLLASPLALVGCSRNYTITISVAEGRGGVYFAHNGGSSTVVGENAVEGDSKFEYYISPDSGYYISKIVVDGVETAYTQSEALFSDSEGRLVRGKYCYFDKIKANHKVAVYFAKLACEIRLMAAGNGAAGELWKTVYVEYGSQIDLNENIYGGPNNKLWYQISENTGNRIYLFNGLQDPSLPATDPNHVANVIPIEGTKEVVTYYCDLTVAELNVLVANLTA